MFLSLIREIIFQSRAFNARTQFGVGPARPANHEPASEKQPLVGAFVLYYDQLIE